MHGTFHSGPSTKFGRCFTHPKGVFSRLGRSKYLSSGRPSAQGAAAVMAAAYYSYQYHETDECRQLREGYNETNTGEKGGRSIR